MSAFDKNRKRGRGWRPNLPRPLDAARKEKFLLALAEHGIIGEAAKVASIHSHHGCLATFYRERERDPVFAQAWAEAMEVARHAVEYELHRRAVKGVDEPVYYLGKEVGTITRYSDALLLALVRKLNPEFRPAHRVEHAGTVNVKPIGLEQLSKTQRGHLREILAEQIKDAEVTVVETRLLPDTVLSEASSEDSSTGTGGDSDDQESNT